ncbi:hypothetical protein BJ878DRAFT_479413 [Calycina marina]|uniref:Uncharacterized protein n=1 Tax=Calycina marina TaxID=1763456 RepID=A0A9P7Z5F6_9HELO|nr:hypothetical protein BJ878DRAFT_479413 [Calycina marina]
MSSSITSHARTDELVAFSTRDLDGFTPFLTSTTVGGSDSATSTSVSSEKPAISINDIDGVRESSRAEAIPCPPIVPQHTAIAMDEKRETGMSGSRSLSRRIELSRHDHLEALSWVMVGPGVLLLAVLMGWRRIGRRIPRQTVHDH